MLGILVKQHDCRHGLYSWQGAKSLSSRVPKKYSSWGGRWAIYKKKAPLPLQKSNRQHFAFPLTAWVPPPSRVISTPRYKPTHLTESIIVLAMHFWAPVWDMKTRNGTRGRLAASGLYWNIHAIFCQWRSARLELSETCMWLYTYQTNDFSIGEKPSVNVSDTAWTKKSHPVCLDETGQPVPLNLIPETEATATFCWTTANSFPDNHDCGMRLLSFVTRLYITNSPIRVR